MFNRLPYLESLSEKDFEVDPAKEDFKCWLSNMRRRSFQHVLRAFDHAALDPPMSKEEILKSTGTESEPLSSFNKMCSFALERGLERLQRFQLFYRAT